MEKLVSKILQMATDVIELELDVTGPDKYTGQYNSFCPICSNYVTGIGYSMEDIRHAEYCSYYTAKSLLIDRSWRDKLNEL